MGMGHSVRHVLAALAFAGVLAFFCVLLVQAQVIEGEGYYETSLRSKAKVESVPAARGKILDRNGKVLVRDEVRWTAVVAEGAPEESRARLAQLCREEGVRWDGEGAVTGVTARLLARGKEEGLEGVTFSPAVERVGSGALAPHVLGRVGAMSPEQWEELKRKGYAMEETVGKDGAEAAFEEALHGTPGRRYVETAGSGWDTEPVAGKNVTLTLDKDLQAAAQDALQAFLDGHPNASGGAVVALDVEDGGVLAMASLPGYDPETFSKQYGTLAQDEGHPLMNRAIQGLYAPGSAFKLVTATAALEEGVLTPETKILDTGRYTYYKSPQPQCWLYRQAGKTHGLETVTDAIADSCNIFFFDAGRRVGIETLGAYAKDLGLGEKTGIELAGEQAGVVAGPAYTASVGGTWYEGSVLSAAIGQENHRFTPVQLAHMTATLVSGGERRQVHLLKQVAGEKAQEAVSLGKIALSEKNLTAIKEGMRRVVQSGSLAEAFRDLPVTAGAKTGSAQVAGEEEANAVLVCFAPYDAPKIALALVAEQGGSGAALGDVAASILNTWAAGNLS